MRKNLICFGLLGIAWMAEAAHNPAYLYCIEKGGESEIRKDRQGNQFGICKFNVDGVVSECSQWEFFRGLCQPGDCSHWSVETRRCVSEI